MTGALEWLETDATTYTAIVTTVNGHTVSVCLDDEGPLHPAYYWDIDNRAVDGWANTVKGAMIDAVQAAKNLSEIA